MNRFSQQSNGCAKSEKPEENQQSMERTAMTLRKAVKSENVLAGLISKAIEFRADEIEIEYKDGYEEVFAMRDWLGISVGKIESGSEEARALRQLLHKVKGKTKIRDGEDYQIRVAIHESFGEDAFRLSFRRLKLS
ncbi:MAG: hypothetical protein KKH04_19810 [Proteobacteria bacterium]|nr:hypothetical protein [Pseudomonadota bacterium]